MSGEEVGPPFPVPPPAGTQPSLHLSSTPSQQLWESPFPWLLLLSGMLPRALPSLSSQMAIFLRQPLLRLTPELGHFLSPSGSPWEYKFRSSTSDRHKAPALRAPEGGDNSPQNRAGRSRWCHVLWVWHQLLPTRDVSPAPRRQRQGPVVGPRAGQGVASACTSPVAQADSGWRGPRVGLFPC